MLPYFVTRLSLSSNVEENNFKIKLDYLTRRKDCRLRLVQETMLLAWTIFEERMNSWAPLDSGKTSSFDSVGLDNL